MGFEDIVNWLNLRVDDLLGRFCKTMTTGRLFPLPSSPYVVNQLFPSQPPGVLMVLRCLVRSRKGLMKDCERAAGWCMEGKAPSWKEFFKVKGVDYKGEEVLTAQEMRWENVAPALPNEVGTVPLEDVVELGSKHYVLNFEDYLLEPEDQVAVRPPRVLVPPDNWGEFCSNLLKIGVFAMVHEDDIYQVGGPC